MNPPTFKQVKLLLLDVDGVLTVGEIIYTDSGEQIKCFDSKDGLGLRLLMDHGIHVGIITGRRSQALIKRCENLGIDLIFDGVKDKIKALEAIICRFNIELSDVAYMGDDLPDLGVMKKVGIGICPADAVPEVREHADIITKSPGGRGAVREVCESILKAKGYWDQIVAGHLK